MSLDLHLVTRAIFHLLANEYCEDFCNELAKMIFDEICVLAIFMLCKESVAHILTDIAH